MKLGTAIHNVTETLGIPTCGNCNQMQIDFDNAEYVKDYARAVLDRIYKRGNYQPKDKQDANVSN